MICVGTAPCPAGPSYRVRQKDFKGAARISRIVRTRSGTHARHQLPNPLRRRSERLTSARMADELGCRGMYDVNDLDYTLADAKDQPRPPESR